MKIPSFRKSYQRHVGRLSKRYSTAKAMSIAVGGNFDAVGKVEYALLRQYGLKQDDFVIDVGCGSGRLGFQLKDFLSGTYVGIDVVPELFQYAERKCGRPDWRFYEAEGLSIAEGDDCADFVCFFSVFTHLMHEESFKYLKEAARVVKPDGKIIISFLEFKILSHWTVFEQSLADKTPDKVLNQFISRDAIEVWAERIGLEIIALHDGDKPHIRLETPIRWDDGREMIGEGNLGQSVCVLTKS